MNHDVILSVESVFKSFPTAIQPTPVLKDISFKITQGEFIIIFGPSGSGKSTLLHAMLGLEAPTKGKVVLGANDLYRLSEDQRSRLRKKFIGMIYQQPLWVHSLNVAENVSLPLMLMGQLYETANQEALKALQAIGMQEWAQYLPAELSSGQQQRIALARALIMKPSVIVADEPTGNLDFDNGTALLQKLQKINQVGTTVIMVTHDLGYLSYADRAFEIVNGQLHQTFSAQDIKQKLEQHYVAATSANVRSEKKKV